MRTGRREADPGGPDVRRKARRDWPQPGGVRRSRARREPPQAQAPRPGTAWSQSTDYRYATTYSIKATPPDEELDDFFGKIEALLTEAASRFGVDLAMTGAPAKNANPIR